MIKLTIIQNDKYANYVLKDIENNKYYMNINFINMDNPKVGAVIYIPDSVINEKVPLNYGSVRDNDSVTEEELMVLYKDNKKFYLQRFYG